MAKSILYYPTIDIKNEKWLKSAVLYWDKVCTIVPFTSYDDFSGNIRYLEERNQFRRLYPADMFFSEYYDEFSGEIERKAHNLIRKRRKCKNGLFDDPMDIIQDGTLYSLIHYKKIPTEIFDWLQKKNLIRFNDKLQWVEMDKDFSLAYMKVLAKYIAKSDEEELDFGTDRISKMNSFFYRTKPKAGNEVLSIILEKCLPVPREDVPFEDLINFKERRQDDLFELHKKIDDLKVNLVSCERREEIKASIADFNHSWQKEMRQSEKLFLGDGIALCLESMQTFISNAGGVAGLFATGDSSFTVPVAIGAGLIGVCLQYRKYKHRLNENRTSDEFAYVIGAGRRGLLENNW